MECQQACSTGGPFNLAIEWAEFGRTSRSNNPNAASLAVERSLFDPQHTKENALELAVKCIR